MIDIVEVRNQRWNPAPMLALAALLLAATPTGGRAEGSQTSPISQAQLSKLLAYLPTRFGFRGVFHAPVGFDFGWTTDPHEDVPEIEVSTDDKRYAFAQSQLNTADYSIAEFEDEGAYLFVTKADFRLVKAFFSPRGPEPQQILDTSAPSVKQRYQKALVAWAADIDQSPPPPTK